jgi:peptide/nickel transport system permease protein
VLNYAIQRGLQMVVLVFIISLIAFIVIQLPPGDFVDSYMSTIAGGETLTQEAVQALRQQFGLDQPIYVQYVRWMSNVISGNFGLSFRYERTVADLLSERLPLTLAITLPTTILVYLVAVPIGIYSALHQYSLLDYLFSFIGFTGVAIPNFLFAIILIYIGSKYFGANVGGLFSPQYELEPWSFAKFLDMLSNLWIPVIVVGTAGTAGTIRVMRGMLLDELNQPYVETARAKGLPEMRLIFKYPVRIALSPVLSTIGFTLPALISGTAIVAIVLNLPTTGPLLLNALLSQDMFLAGSIILILSVLTVFGTFVSDLLLVWADPRIRLSK